MFFYYMQQIILELNGMKMKCWQKYENENDMEFREIKKIFEERYLRSRKNGMEVWLEKCKMKKVTELLLPPSGSPLAASNPADTKTNSGPYS